MKMARNSPPDMTESKTSAKPRTDGDSDKVIITDQPYAAPPPRRSLSSRSEAACYELRTMLQDGMQREAHRLGQTVRLQWTRDASRVEAMAHDSAGIILVGPHEQKTLDIVKASGVPVVRLGCVAPLERADHVGGTDHEAGIAVGEYLVGLGHRDIAFLQGEEGYRGRMERYHGLRESLERYPDTRLHNLHFKEDGGFIPALRSLQATGIAPTARFCAHDGLALTAVSELLAWGYRLSSRCKSLDPLEWGMASHPAHD
jgi:LacI family transcriptional regulator